MVIYPLNKLEPRRDLFSYVRHQKICLASTKLQAQVKQIKARIKPVPRREFGELIEKTWSSTAKSCKKNPWSSCPVGGFSATPLKNIWVKVNFGMIIETQYEWEKSKFMATKPPTSLPWSSCRFPTNTVTDSVGRGVVAVSHKPCQLGKHFRGANSWTHQVAPPPKMKHTHSFDIVKQ